MATAQYAILRFAKYKGPEISGIEAHNERTKEKYASNPDIDPSRTHLNFHLIKPERKYRAESERQIAEAGCRTRSDSVRVVEALITATPEFFKGKKRSELKEFFNEALEFIKQNQAPETIISAVVHLDEKSPHMHLCFVPLTEDKRLCAKEILGNKKKLTQWQDKYWEHMVKKYPDLERGESASETGRDLTSIPIPQSLFALIVIFRPILIFWGWIVKCVHHHEFVVAQKHFDIRHRHDLTEDFDAVGVAVYHISKDIERVLRLQVDLLHDGIKAPLLPMDI